MLGYWPYATHKKIYIYIFVTLRRKPGILNTRFLFLQYKKKTQKKINTHALLGYCSSELNFTWTVTSELRMHAKVGNKRHLTWSAGDAFFFSPPLSAFVCRSPVLLASFSFLLPVFFSSLSLLLYSAFLFLKAGAEMDEDDRCWSFCAQPMVAASRDSESDGHAGFGLCSFSPSADAFSQDDKDDGDEGMLCWWSCRPCLCVFLAFNSVVLMAFSALPLSCFFLFFFSRFFCSLPLPYGFHSNEGKERNSLCSLHFISTPSVLFSFSFCCSLFHVPVKAF